MKHQFQVAKPTRRADAFCHFCSRPKTGHNADDFAFVRIKLSGVEDSVLGCVICRKRLDATGKVKVLFFRKDGKPVHWREVKDYRPSEQYWNLNAEEKQGRISHLRLVPARPDR